MTDRMPDSAERDGQTSGPGRPNAVRVRPGQPKTGQTAPPGGGARDTLSQPLTKAERRALVKERKARAIRAKKRRQALVGSLAGLAVVVVIVGAVFLFSRPTHHAASPGASGTPSAAIEASATPSFPPVPAGADPALSTKPTVATPSGDVSKLNVTTLIAGTGPAVASGQTITVNYVGVAFQTGQEFDSSWSRSQAFTTQIGTGSVIAGWDQGLVGVKVGSRVQLDIPSALAYPNPANGQPAGPLRFVVDVLAVS